MVPGLVWRLPFGRSDRPHWCQDGPEPRAPGRRLERRREGPSFRGPRPGQAAHLEWRTRVPRGPCSSSIGAFRSACSSWADRPRRGCRPRPHVPAMRANGPDAPRVSVLSAPEARQAGTRADLLHAFHAALASLNSQVLNEPKLLGSPAMVLVSNRASRSASSWHWANAISQPGWSRPVRMPLAAKGMAWSARAHDPQRVARPEGFSQVQAVRRLLSKELPDGGEHGRLLES